VPADRHALLLARLADIVPGGSALEQLCLGSVDMLGVTGAAVILMSDREIGATVVASNKGANAIEDLQFTLGEGPCLDVFNSGTAVLAADMPDGVTERWPVFARQALAAGAQAMFVLPLHLGAIRLGVLYLYRDKPGMLSDDQLADGYLLAELATTELLEAQSGADPGTLGPGLAGGWTNRALVHQATGMVGAQLEVDLAEAIARIRARAFGTGQSVYDLAVDVVERRLRFER
jgi:hypothetical protein